MDDADVIPALSNPVGRKHMADGGTHLTKYASSALIKVINLTDKKTSKLLMSQHQQ